MHEGMLVLNRLFQNINQKSGNWTWSEICVKDSTKVNEGKFPILFLEDSSHTGYWVAIFVLFIILEVTWQNDNANLLIVSCDSDPCEAALTSSFWKACVNWGSDLWNWYNHLGRRRLYQFCSSYSYYKLLRILQWRLEDWQFKLHSQQDLGWWNRHHWYCRQNYQQEIGFCFWQHLRTRFQLRWLYHKCRCHYFWRELYMVITSCLVN